MKVLIASNDLSVCSVLEEWVPKWDYTPVVVSNDENLWQTLTANNPPRLVILDESMPTLDNLTLCQQLKQQKDSPVLYLLLLTADNAQPEMITPHQAEADDFLVKPIQPQQLQSRLAIGKRMISYQDELTHHHEQLQTLLSAMPGVMLFKDEQGRWLQANDACLQLFKLQDVDYVGKSDDELAQQPRARASLLKALQTKDEQAWQAPELVQDELHFIDDKNKTTYYELTRVPFFSHEGQRKNIVLLGHNITIQKRLEQRLTQEAKYDLLTNLLNQRAFESALEAAINYTRRFKHPLSLCLCDIDDFKNINDTYGHSVGDTVLSQFGQILRHELRRVDAAGRIQGDKFSILFAGSTAHESLNCLTRIRKRLKEIEFQDKEGQPFSVSVSFGVAEWLTHSMINKEILLQAAEKALRQAQLNGRDQVIIYTKTPT